MFCRLALNVIPRHDNGEDAVMLRDSTNFLKDVTVALRGRVNFLTGVTGTHRDSAIFLKGVAVARRAGATFPESAPVTNFGRGVQTVNAAFSPPCHPAPRRGNGAGAFVGSKIASIRTY